MSCYGVISDLHFHDWSHFSKDDAHGVNSRLTVLLNEVRRVAKSVLAKGGVHLFVAGDVFHVRGKVSPLVLNPVKDMFREIRGWGIKTHILSGNHDLEGKHSGRLSSAVTALEEVVETVVSNGLEVVDVGWAKVGMLPWVESIADLMNALTDIDPSVVDDLIIHAPMNAVIKGLPDTGLDPDWVAELGFRNVFSGHYHNHRMTAERVYSIGAIAHHNWNDVGSRAGHLLVEGTDGRVTFQASHCPSFIELTSEMDEATMTLEADGAYIKARLETADQTAIQGVREALMAAGALGVITIAEPESKAVERKLASIVKGMTTQESVLAYINAGPFTHKVELANEIVDILVEAGSVE